MDNNIYLQTGMTIVDAAFETFFILFQKMHERFQGKEVVEVTNS